MAEPAMLNVGKSQGSSGRYYRYRSARRPRSSSCSRSESPVHGGRPEAVKRRPLAQAIQGNGAQRLGLQVKVARRSRISADQRGEAGIKRRHEQRHVVGSPGRRIAVKKCNIQAKISNRPALFKVWAVM